jgi:hypothetical protein
MSLTTNHKATNTTKSANNVLGIVWDIAQVLQGGLFRHNVVAVLVQKGQR